MACNSTQFKVSLKPTMNKFATSDIMDVKNNCSRLFLLTPISLYHERHPIKYFGFGTIIQWL